jgi:hypothetical protein
MKSTLKPAGKVRVVRRCRPPAVLPAAIVEPRFTFASGLPTPVRYKRGDVADGLQLFDLDQAARRMSCRRETLVQFYIATLTFLMDVARDRKSRRQGMKLKGGDRVA